MLDDAGRMIREEVSLLTAPPGGMVEYRKTLAISFLFKFYLDVLKQLKRRVNKALFVCGTPWGREFVLDASPASGKVKGAPCADPTIVMLATNISEVHTHTQ